MELNHERYGLNFLCEFRNKEVESEFREHEKASSFSIVRIMLLLMGVTFALFSIYDYFTIGGDSSFTTVLFLRGAALVVTIAAFFLAGKFKLYEHTLVVIILVILFIFAIFLVSLYLRESHEPSLRFMTVILFLLGVFLIPSVWKFSLIGSLIILGSYIIFCNAIQVYYPVLAGPMLLSQQIVYLSVCLIFCAIFIYGREHSQRRHFAAEKLMEHMIITDRLTGIYNRGRFEYILDLWVKNLRHGPFCLTLFDIDDFKKVNDRFGHNVGDQVLIAVTEAVNANIRDTDVFARWGGEEFVVLFDEVELYKGIVLAERLRKAVEDNNHGEAGTVTISLGIVEYKRGETMLDLVERADAKMYEAKRAGKNKVIGDNYGA